MILKGFIKDPMPQLRHYNGHDPKEVKEYRSDFKEWAKTNMDGYEYDRLYPDDCGKKVVKAGSWVKVLRPPRTEYTVPPFSMWFARPWPMNGGTDMPKLQRVKIMTPMGDLGLFPEEYALVDGVEQWFGREHEGVHVRNLDKKPLVNPDVLNYVMSRGIPRAEAIIMLLHTIKDQSFMWVEVAPQYGEHFGFEWPEPEKCNFATPRDNWIEE